jgi:hypothetical protein
MLQLLKSKFPKLDQQKLIQLQSKFVYGDNAITVKINGPGLEIITYAIRFPKYYLEPWMADNNPVKGFFVPRYHYSGTKLPREVLRQFYHYLKDQNCLFRSEGQTVSVYFKTLQEAEPFIQLVTDTDFTLIRRISAVENIQTQGEIAVRSASLSEYRYQIHLADFDINEDPKNRIGELFENFFDSVRLTESIKRLTNRTKKNDPYRTRFFHGGYFYSKDEAIVTYLSLSWPKLIKKVYRVTYIGK